MERKPPRLSDTPSPSVYLLDTNIVSELFRPGIISARPSPDGSVVSTRVGASGRHPEIETEIEGAGTLCVRLTPNESQ